MILGGSNRRGNSDVGMDPLRNRPLPDFVATAHSVLHTLEGTSSQEGKARRVRGHSSPAHGPLVWLEVCRIYVQFLFHFLLITFPMMHFAARVIYCQICDRLRRPLPVPNQRRRPQPSWSNAGSSEVKVKVRSPRPPQPPLSWITAQWITTSSLPPKTSYQTQNT